jgi:hypothetical protein
VRGVSIVGKGCLHIGLSHVRGVSIVGKGCLHIMLSHVGRS